MQSINAVRGTATQRQNLNYWPTPSAYEAYKRTLDEMSARLKKTKFPEIHTAPRVKPGSIKPRKGIVTTVLSKGQNPDYWLAPGAWKRMESWWKPGVLDIRTQESPPSISTSQVNAGREKEDSKWLITIGLLAAFSILVMMREV